MRPATHCQSTVLESCAGRSMGTADGDVGGRPLSLQPLAVMTASAINPERAIDAPRPAAPTPAPAADEPLVIRIAESPRLAPPRDEPAGEPLVGRLEGPLVLAHQNASARSGSSSAAGAAASGGR